MLVVAGNSQMVVNPVSRSLRIAATGLLLTLAAGAAAQAQSMSSNSGSFNAGYGRAPGDENRGVSIGSRDANGNRVIVDGIIQGGMDQSVISRTSMQGASGSGAGFGGATAIGNNLTVITQGNWNTVIVNSTQTNTGDVSANSSGDDGN
jgi:holdfast attachment protein HfaA